MVQTKSRHHKNENTHHFLTLAERLSNLNVDVVKRINRNNLKPEETETYFHQTLTKWFDLNYSAVFNEFNSKLRNKCHSLAQLIYHKETLADILIEYIGRADPLSLQPILDLTAQFARDLQVDFYPFFPRIFHAIVGLLDTQDTDVLEWSFQTLSYLFKFLWRYMLKDLENVYNLYSPLLNESRKAYIRNFSVESFAFLMRKITDKNQLFDFLLNRLIKKSDELDGIGRLMFEMFRGIKHQFNACTEQSLGILLEKIHGFNQHENELVLSCIGKTLEAMAEFTKKEHSSLVWRCFYKSIDKNLNNQAKLTDLMRLMYLFLKSKDCYLIDNLDDLTENLSKVGKLDLNSPETKLQLTESLMKICHVMLLSENVKFAIEKANIVPNMIYQPKYDPNQVFDLTRKLFPYEQFETLILPNVISYFDAQTINNENNEKFLNLMVEYLVRHKKIINSELVEDLKTGQSSLNFVEKFNQVKDLSQLTRLFSEKKFTGLKLYSSLEKFLSQNAQFYLESKENHNELILAETLLLVPIVFPTSKHLSGLIDRINDQLVRNLSRLSSDQNWEKFESESFLLSLSHWTYTISNRCESVETRVKHLVELISKVGEHGKTMNNLFRALNYSIVLSNEKGNLRPILKDVITIVKSHLSSPYHEIRLNSLNLLDYYFRPEMETIERIKLDDDEELNLFEICTKAEMTRASLEEYRRKLFYIQRLDTNVCSKYFQLEQLKDVPLRYFFGLLFENFKLLWDPIVTLIQNYANHMKMNEFWNVFFEYFSQLTEKIENIPKSLKQVEVTEDSLLDLELLKSVFSENNQNIDYMNNRYLLCQAMKGFTSICESRTKQLVPIFFRFMNNEYYLEENRLLSTAYDDITQKFAERQANQKSAKEKFFSKKLLNKHLCAYLEVFALFTSPKSWHQEENLRNLYLNLLCHQEASVQKLALKCLYTYQYSYLMPYKENLERLLEGKYFRRELVIFSLDAANGVVHSDDRVKLLPILMRLLYGKFHSNETTHTASKDTKSNKRSVIIQFLSQCNEYELNYFFNLIFDCLNTAIDRHANNEKANGSEERFEKNPNELDSTERSKALANLLKCLDSTSSAIYDLKHTIPFKKILGVLQSLEIVMRKLARQMESFSHRILQMLGFIHKYAITIHEKAQDLKRNENNPVDEYHVNLLKIIRQQVTLRFKQFFEIYDHLNFSQEEYFYIYETFIWPQALRVPNESLKSVSNVLKLMSIWSSHPRYYPLLVVRADNFTQCSSLIAELNDSYAFKRKNMLDILFELIDSQQCSSGVINFVIEMIYNLVSYADFVEESDENEDSFGSKKLPFDVGFIQDEFKTEAKDLNFGTMVLKPYVTSIVSHVERIVISNMSKKTLPPKPLKILARLSGFASNSTQQCEKIIQLLIPYLIKNRKQDEETQLNILSSINHLIRQVKNVDEFICPLSRLFSAIGNRQSRVEICNIFESIKQIDSKYEFISTLVNDLNSWDPKRLEEPDYMRRLDGYKRLNEAVQQWTQFDTKLASILLYNCFFFIKNIGDLALKESSTHCVIQFLKKSASLELNKSDKYLFEANFLAELKSGLKSKVENARHEFIAILVEFIKSFQSIFTTYNDLNLLFDEDIEKDFYENIKHIQMHRRARALKKLQRACAEKQLSSESLLNFLMPLVRSFIDNEMYHKYDYIVEDACKAMGAICSVLAWPKYIKILEFYLKSLVKAPPKATSAAANAKNEKKKNETESNSGPNQKLVIKIICFILDAFHYDLSLSSQKGFYFSESSQKAVVEKKKEEKMEEEEEKQEEEETDGPKKTLVGSAMANKIHATLSQSIIPMLFKCLTKRLKSDGEHKVNKKEDESEQILRVPIALALLKLLVNLPSRTFETHLPGLLFKVCDMLKSRAISVRISTRECLMKMIDALPQKRYYSFVFKELSNALSRGYQAHVLCFTIYEVLKKVESRLVCGDLDASLDTIMASVNLELFTDVSEEKEVKQIVAKTLEAKTVSSYGTLEILAKFVSKNNMLRILKPFKEQLDVCNSKKLLKKIEDALKRVLLGFLANQSLSTVDLMEVAHGLLNDTLDVLKDPGKFKKRNKASLVNDEDKKEEEKKTNALQKSCLIIPYEPKRGGDKPKVLTRTNQHVIVEFALQLLHNLLKQNRLNEEKDEQKKEEPSKSENTANYKEMLEPYVPIFVDYLDGKYIKVTIITLRCLVAMLRFNLKSIEERSSVLGTKLFSLLRTFSSASTTSTPSSSGDNFELLMVCYKLIACLIRDCTHFELSDDQLQTLLHCAERNLFDTHKQASTFNLLKAIVSRRFESDDLGEIMGRVMKLSIQAESPPVRAQSRQTVMSYLIAYAMGAGKDRDEKKFAKIVEFYVVQLNYEYENGRESAIEMLATMFNTFPTEKLNEHCAMFFLPLAVQLHNDESSKCKKLAWMALKSLLEKIDIEHQDALFQITASLFRDSEKPLHKRIAALLTKIFVEVEKQQFERRLDTVLEILSSEIDSKNYESEIENNTSTLINEKFYDQYLFNLLTLFMKILTECKLIENKKHLSVINKIFDQVKIYLLHEHLWVRLISCQLFGHLFAAQTIEELVGNKKNSYFSFSTKNKYEKIRDLIDSFCVQMKSPVLDTELAEQIVKNLAFMAKVINRNEEEFSSMETTHLDHDLNMEWLIKKVIREAKYELVNKPKETIKRIHIFKWIAAVVHELGKEKINNYLGLLMGVLQREAVIEQNDENLKRLAHEVLEFIKQIIGTEEYSLLLAKSNKRRVENKEERKRKIAQTAILDPQLAAMKKIRKMQKKKDAKKRKIESNKSQIMNGGGGKKRKLMTKEKDDF